jgi:hypothetical protein
MSAGMVRAQSEPPFVFTVLGPTGVIARVITDDTACPEITVDGATSAMQLRAGPEANYPNTVCEAAIPPAATSASVLGQPLKLAKARPERVVVLGDTGCRMKGETMQSCNDPTQWPFAPLAASAAQSNPDLIIHVGDYHYRESPCIVDKANCAGSPFGFNWASWNADFFTPARPLLASAPWVMLRGNHEDCSRAGGGYFRMLDPRPLSAACPTYTDPYALDYMDPQLIVVDNSAVNDFEIEPDQLAEYTRQAEMMRDNLAAPPRPAVCLWSPGGSGWQGNALYRSVDDAGGVQQYLPALGPGHNGWAHTPLSGIELWRGSAAVAGRRQQRHAARPRDHHAADRARDRRQSGRLRNDD